MQEENVYEQEEVVVQEENTTTDEETVTPEETHDDTVTLSNKEYKALKRQSIAYNAIKDKGESRKPTTNNAQLSDELKLIARGLSDEEIDQAKVIAKGTGVSLTEAIKNPLFTLYQDKVKEDRKKEDARLGASHGSGESQSTETVRPNMTREEHEQAFKKVMGI